MARKKTPFPVGEIHSNEFIDPQTGEGNNPIPEVGELLCKGKYNERASVGEMHSVDDEVVLYLYNPKIAVSRGRFPQKAYQKIVVVVEDIHIGIPHDERVAKLTNTGTVTINGTRSSSMRLRRIA